MVVDERIDARVGVRQTVPEHAQYQVERTVGRVAEVEDEQVDVQRQPEHGKDDDDEDEQTTRLTLLGRRSGIVGSSDGDWAAVTTDVAQDTQREHGDHAQRNHVSVGR